MVTLDKIFRQEGENIEQKRFHQLLTNLRDVDPQIEDWKLLMMRTPIDLNATTNENFQNYVHFFSTNDKVYNHNNIMLH